jgi:hypothetical protein
MKIELNISTATLGDWHSADDNKRYAEAVEKALVTEYLDAEISITLDDYVSETTYYVSNDSLDDAENVLAIANRIWEKELY